MSRLVAFVLFLLACAPALVLASPPGTMNYQGVLRDSAGAPVTTATTVVFSIWDADSGGTMLWSETVSVTPSAGVFEVVLGATTPLDPADFTSGPLWLEMEIGGTALTPRQELTSVPWALRAATADALDDPAPASYQVPLGGIIDWYAFSASDPVPDGYAICDGSTVSDPLSPFLGQTLPNLVDAFAMGVATVGATGTTGGANTVDLEHQHVESTHTHGVPNHSHDFAHTHSVDSHNHTMHHGHNVSHNHAHSHGGLNHRHRWARFVGSGADRFDTFNGSASDTATSANETLNGNEMDEAGTGTTTLAKSSSQPSEYFYTSGAMEGSNGRGDTTDTDSTTSNAVTNTAYAASGGYTTGSGSTLKTGTAAPGTGAASPDSTTDEETGVVTAWNAAGDFTGTAGNPAHDNRPAWVGLLKIMRIR